MNKNEIRDRAFAFAMTHNMLNKGDKVVAGISGGADSMCLLGLLLEWRELLNLEIYVVHVNHGIRGEAADGDEGFVREFCGANNVAFRAVHADIPKMAQLSGCTEEEEGRNLRYRVFTEVSEEFGCNRIAVAHNRSDNAETVIFNMLRGSGIPGLKGITPVREIFPDNTTDVNNKDRGGGDNAETGLGKNRPVTLIRPLLNTSREEIEAYLSECGMTFRTDATNFEEEYSRNVLRNSVFPIFRERINSASEDHIIRLAQQAAEVDSFLTDIVDRRMSEMETKGCLEYLIQEARSYNKAVLGSSTGVDGSVSVNSRTMTDRIIGCRIGTEALNGMEGLIRRMVIRNLVGRLAGRLKDIANVHIEDIVGLLDKQVGKRIDLPYGLTARRDYDGLVIEKKGAAEQLLQDDKELVIKLSEFARYSEDDKRIVETEGVKPLKLGLYCTDRVPDTDFTKNLYTKLFDCDKIKNDVSIRRRRSGDFLMLRGRNGDTVRKSLKSWMIDNKIPADIRDRIMLLTEGSHVLWIIGYRRDDSCLIDEHTKNILAVEILYLCKDLEERHE